MNITRDELKIRMRELLQQHHRGADSCISMTALYRLATGELVIPNRRYDQTRAVRALVAEMRREGNPIGFRQGRDGGYFWALDPRELETTIATFHSRALASLVQEKALRRITSRDLARQVELELETTTVEEEDDDD